MLCVLDELNLQIDNSPNDYITSTNEQHFSQVRLFESYVIFHISCMFCLFIYWNNI